jgi:hypothetical protein
MAPRTKGKSNAPPPTAAVVPVLPTDPITVPAGDSPPAPSELATQPQKKKTAKPEKGSTKKKYIRGKAALKQYWQEIAILAPPDMPLDTLKDAVQNMRKIAVTQLKQKGTFKLHGICEMRVRHVKGRDAGASKLFGKAIEVKARPAHKKVIVKVTKCLADNVVREANM